MSEHIIDVNSDNFQVEVVQADLPVIVDFWATWCGPCMDLMPTLAKLSSHYAGRVKFVKVNVDENKDLVTQFGVTGFPTLLLLKQGTQIARMLGVQSRSQLTNLLDQYVPILADEGIGQTNRGYRAFHGSSDLKHSTIERVQRLIDDERIVTMMFAPNFDAASGQHTLMTAAVPTTDPKMYEEKLGIPWRLGRLEAFIHNFLMRDVGNGIYAYRGPSSRHPVDWLRALPLGKDLQPVTPAFLNWWLRDLADEYFSPIDEAVSGMAKTIAGLHARASRGDAPTTQEWQVARQQAGALAKPMDGNRDGDDISSHMLLNAAESLAWPPEDLDVELGGAIGSIYSALATRASRTVYNKDEWDQRDALTSAMHKSMENMPEPTPELMQEDAAVQAFRDFMEIMRPREMAAINEAKYAYGERLHLGLMSALQSVQ